MAENRSFDDLLADRLENSRWAIQAKQADDAATAAGEQSRVERNREQIKKLRREIVTPALTTIAARLMLGHNAVFDCDPSEDVCESRIAASSNRHELEICVRLSAAGESIQASVLCRAADRLRRSSENWMNLRADEREFAVSDAQVADFSDWLHGHLVECAALADTALRS